MELQKGIRPGTEMRNELLKTLMDMGLNAGQIAQITHQLTGKTDPEKEKIAKRILLKLNKLDPEDADK